MTISCWLMETILFVAPTESDGSLGKPALETLNVAKNLADAIPGSKLAVAVFGEKLDGAAALLGGCGAARCLGIANPDLAQPRYASDAAATEALSRAAQATIVIAPGTSRMNRVLAGVAHRLQGRIDTHVTAVTAAQNQPVITRWYYRQRMEACIQRTHRPWIIAIDPGSAQPWSGQPQPTSLEMLQLPTQQNGWRTRVTGIQAPPADEQTIRPDAELLFVAGAGWTKKQADGQTHVDEAAALILEFLKHTRASLGSSKSLVDISGEGQAVLPFLTHMNQVGQTGSTPRHPKGLAACCHGEEPHTVGWRFINERRAINLDPNCGWARGKADVLYVADAFAVMRKLNELFAAQKR